MDWGAALSGSVPGELNHRIGSEIFCREAMVNPQLRLLPGRIHSMSRNPEGVMATNADIDFMQWLMMKLKEPWAVDIYGWTPNTNRIGVSSSQKPTQKDKIRQPRWCSQDLPAVRIRCPSVFMVSSPISPQFQDDGDDTRYGYDDLMAFIKEFGDQKWPPKFPRIPMDPMAGCPGCPVIAMLIDPKRRMVEFKMLEGLMIGRSPASTDHIWSFHRWKSWTCLARDPLGKCFDFCQPHCRGGQVATTLPQASSSIHKHFVPLLPENTSSPGGDACMTRWEILKPFGLLCEGRAPGDPDAKSSKSRCSHDQPQPRIAMARN